MTTQPATQPAAHLGPKSELPGTRCDTMHRDPTQTLERRSPPTQDAIYPHFDPAAEEYKMFISLVFSVSIFGASSFAVAMSQIADPADIWKPQKPPFTMQNVRTFLGAAWLCFTLAIAVAGMSSSFLTLQKSRKERSENDFRQKKLGAIAIAASALLWTLLVVAFLFLSLAMVPYAYVPGWFTMASTVLFGIYIIWLIFSQVREHLRP